MMSGKNKTTTSPDGFALKKQRKLIDPDIKMKILKEYGRGRGVRSLSTMV